MLRRRHVDKFEVVAEGSGAEDLSESHLTVQQRQMIPELRGVGVHYLLITWDRAEAYWAGAGKHLQTRVCLPGFQRQAC